MSNIKPTRLAFKGSKNTLPPNNDTKGKRIVSNDEGEQNKEKATLETISTAWVPVEHARDVMGPLFILQRISNINDTDKNILYSLCFHENGSVTQNLENKESLEPDNISQILVGQWLGPDILCLKTSYNKYISSDRYGVVTTNKEAVGSQEQWIPVIDNDVISFQHRSFRKFLSYDSNIKALRADSDSIRDKESFIIKCQEKYKNKRSADTNTVHIHSNPLQYELDQALRYQSWQDRRLKLASDNTEELKKAKEQGRLHESLLKRRIKMKSDKYCK